jgi:hypothetical protein
MKYILRSFRLSRVSAVKTLRPILIALATLLSAVPLAQALPLACHWTFDGALTGRMGDVPVEAFDGQADARWCEGVQAKALAVTGNGVSFRLPAAYAAAGALSFHYRISPAAKGQGERTEILRFGGRRLLYDRGRLLWVAGESPYKNWSPRHSFLSADRLVLIEIGWSVEQGCWIFVNGLAVTRMEGLSPEEPAGETVTLTFVEGVFDEARIEPDARASGARFRGLLVREDFEKGLTEEWREANRMNAPRVIEGCNGTKQALAGPIKAGPHFSIYLPLGFFRVTEDLRFCATVRSSNGKVSTCLVRTWPGAEAMKEHVNNWLRWDVPPEEWTPQRLPIVRWGVKPGWIVQGLSFGSLGPEERTVAVDNVCLIRGEDRTPPAQVEGLKAVVKDGVVSLAWSPAQDDVGVGGYNVYWSNTPAMWLDERERIAVTIKPEFRHEFIPHPGRYYYAVSAVDLFGNVGKASAVALVEVAE